MKLNQRFGTIFDEFIKIKIQRKQLLNLLEKLHTKYKISIRYILLLVKALVIVLSLQPSRLKMIIEIIKLFMVSKINKKIILLLDKVYDQKINLSDKMVERLIINTIKLFKILSNKKLLIDNIFLIFYNILLSISKIRILSLRGYVYVNLINESLKINNKKSILEIINICNNTPLIINKIN